MTEGFSNVIVETTVHLLPSRCNNSEQVEEGVRNLLNGMLMRYNPQLQGIVMAYNKLEILDTHGVIFYERPHIHFNIRVRLLVFRPVVGAYVVGVVNKVEPDHIGLLVHGIFNASVIAATGLSQDFEYEADDSKFVNSTTDQEIEIGTKLRLKISKITHFMQVVSLECTMLDDKTGFC